MLPIESVRADVLSALKTSAVVVSSPTGSGKSTRVPVWCAELGRVLVIEPRRVACRSLATRVAQVDGTPLGRRIGYSVRDDHRARADSAVVFATPGIVLRMIAGGDIEAFHTVILDEFHERSLDVDLILALLRRRYGGRLVVMSATLNGDRVAAAIGGVHIQAKGRTFPVEHRYRSGGTLLPAVRGLEARVAKAVQASKADAGDVLVFLPGKGEIAACERQLAGGDDEILTLHGGLSLSDQGRVFSNSSGRRRVILATNVAETSLTIPGVGVVIDSGLVRQTRYFSDRGFLLLVPIAMDSADQRAGRAGRTAAGICYRLWDQAAVLEPVTPPEIFRESLVPLVLSAAACGEPIDALSLLDPPRPHAVETAVAELTQLGALDAAGVLTDCGRRLFGLPLPSHLGRLLVEARGTPLLHDIIDLVSALGVDRPLFAGPFNPEDEGDMRAGGCDATALIRAVRYGDAGHSGKHSKGQLRSFPLAEARRIRKRLREALSAGPPPSDRPEPSTRALAELIMAADSRAAHVRREHGRHVAWSNGGTEIELARDSAVDADKTEAIAVLNTRAVGIKGKTVIMATCAVPLRPKWMVRAGLGRDRLAGVQVANGVVVGVVERVFARRVLAKREETPTGLLAREAIRDLFVRGTIFKGFQQKLTDRLAATALYHSLIAAGLCDPLWDVERADSETWLMDRLESLGVESGEDLPLLSGSDLLPPALPEPLMEQLDADYPRTVSLGDVVYKARYDLARRIVTLDQVKGNRKELPPLAYLPRFKGFALKVHYRGKTRELRGRR